MGRSTINVKTLDTTRSILETKKTKTQRAKSILVKTRNSILFLNCELRQVVDVLLN